MAVRDADAGEPFLEAVAGDTDADRAALRRLRRAESGAAPGSVARGLADVYEEWLAATKIAYTLGG